MRGFRYFIVAVWMIWGCSETGNSSMEAFIPGTYVREINHEFARGMDTIIISVLDKQSGSFTIIKKTGYERYLDRESRGVEHKTEKLIVLYDQDKRQLRDNQKMVVFTPVPGKKLILYGSLEYKKLQ